ncbi:hypothetical protein DB347_19395 [Opitutaceae bacterium EW11]|nr:hypothetical protein DB347_19395 [Opitutaceae bacterium EW11]
MQAGLLLTIVLWPLIVFLLGAALRHLGHVAPGGPSTAAKPVFNIELAPEEFYLPEKKQPPPDKFVETNPDAPENIPDKTRNFAARNQQVAQEKPTPDGKSDTPALEGKKDREVTQIVSGHLQTQEETPPPAPPPMPAVAATPGQAAPRREQNPLPGEEKIQGDNPDGIGTAASKEVQNAADVPEKVEGQKDAPLLTAIPGQMPQPRIDPQRPQPRRRVDRNVRPAILAENKFGTSNIGPIAIDARWSQYGEYIQKLIETVQVQWERILDQSKVYPPSGSTVTVKFRIEATEGAIAEIVHSESTAGTQAERACISAITARSPYGKWTEDMIAVLGQSQEMTFTFYYY